MLKRKFFATAFTLSGAVIGAGILGLPYVFSRSGFFIGVFWLILLGFLMLFVNLCLGEVSLRTKKNSSASWLCRKISWKLWKDGYVFCSNFWNLFSSFSLFNR